MPFDGSGAEEEAGPDFRVSESLLHELCDAYFLTGQTDLWSIKVPSHASVRRRSELSVRAFREAAHPHLVQRFECDGQLLASVAPASGPTEPLSVKQMRPCELDPQAR